MRHRTAALVCISCCGCGMCRNGRCLRSCLARSSRWTSCKPVPRRSLTNFSPDQHVVALFLELVSLSSSCTLLCPSRRDVHRSPPSCQDMSHGQILRLLGPAEPFHWETRPRGTELPRTSSPLLGTVSTNNLRTLSSSCLSRYIFQATFHFCLTNHGLMSMAGVTSIERRVSNSSLKHRI